MDLQQVNVIVAHVISSWKDDTNLSAHQRKEETQNQNNMETKDNIRPPAMYQFGNKQDRWNMILLPMPDKIAHLHLRKC